jgi:hypothetical protein
LLFRLLFPYFILLIIVVGYIYARQMKLGPVLLKVDRVLFSRYSNDSFFLIIVIAAASYFLIRFELQNTAALDETMVPLGPLTYVFFYGALLLAVIAREVEQPAFREKGISSSRGFWLWDEVDSFRWSKDVITINIARGKKKRVEVWKVNPSSKKEIDQMLKKMVPRRSGRSKKKDR